MTEKALPEKGFPFRVKVDRFLEVSVHNDGAYINDGGFNRHTATQLKELSRALDLAVEEWRRRLGAE